MRQHILVLRGIISVSALAAFSAADLAAADGPTGDPTVVPAGAELEELWNKGQFTEGVAVAPDGTIYFSDIPSTEEPGRILKYNPRSGRTSVFCADSGKSNGLMFDRSGRLIAACGANDGRQALCEITPDGHIRTLVDRYEGKVFNSPNDLVIHPDGSIYFTDPRYVGNEPLELDHMSVYVFVPETGTLTRATTEISKPNGIVCAPDGVTVYVALNDNGKEQLSESQSERSPQMKLLACSRQEDGTLQTDRVLIDFEGRHGIDGMTVDDQGHIYAAVRDSARPGIAVYTPEGKEIAHIPTPSLPTNCCFGRGREDATLYITAGGGLYRIPLKIPGYHPATATLN